MTSHGNARRRVAMKIVHKTTSVLMKMLSVRACETTTPLLFAPGLARLPGSGTARGRTDLVLIDQDLAMNMATVWKDSTLLVFYNFSVGVLRKKSTCAALAPDAPSSDRQQKVPIH
jgi:hypothetical protein